jgi:hypothetical protein
MAEYHGDATPEEIKKQVTANLRGQLAGISTERQVTIDAASAALLLELLPEEKEEEKKEEKAK